MNEYFLDERLEKFWVASSVLDHPSIVTFCNPCFDDLWFYTPYPPGLPLHRPFEVPPGQHRAIREHTIQDFATP